MSGKGSQRRQKRDRETERERKKERESRKKRQRQRKRRRPTQRERERVCYVPADSAVHTGSLSGSEAVHHQLEIVQVQDPREERDDEIHPEREEER